MTTATAEDLTTSNDWQSLCTRDDLVAHSGIAARIETRDGPAQVAIFYLPGHSPELYAIDHHDPFSGANVIARGIVGDVVGEPVVASPLYKQHFRLRDGQCIEDEQVKLRTWRVALRDGHVLVQG
ncbi:nitrite reductase small subunit NirD [Halomonas elongata]|uniref:Assimilatory nitrite reductase (NADH) small subunit n=1 Tax=Halomonas elongata (strain ATCC 33173 / DSM 2581 / NBRC 15536 / NCIMB 2198 / 1H9) TaxID=768066 RepID=E1V5G5_HALED|nr:nitrite reductase small subunit NirD [Halomonas elongata]MDL4863157.1 nitrite reductase small subunit NirD [Halomonas elongata]RAW07446.1 nitrite reductase (NAD(P)H) small subunit [Halomonas elongata]WBF16860.1 nitrite reductase small subunit NirD [Halomonas elongata]WPU45691.1 nitrite reductase small subunit NirD [Halomonas elongata DSM 2581]WVI70535.1 nitrite reductase small subunit NirD [Halomonas elongata]